MASNGRRRATGVAGELGFVGQGGAGGGGCCEQGRTGTMDSQAPAPGLALGTRAFVRKLPAAENE